VSIVINRRILKQTLIAMGVLAVIDTVGAQVYYWPYSN
jgi:hypothetical protein